MVDDSTLFCLPGEKAQEAGILMVDDAPTNLARLRSMLARPGYRLTAARSGKSALRLLEHSNDYAVILMDAAMPDLDGFETVRLIREQKSLQHIPVVFLTAAGRKERIDGAAYAAGAIDYVPRPVDPLVLRAKVSVFVDLYHKSREMERWGVKLDAWISERAAILEEAQAKYRLIAENAGDLIAMLDRSGRRLYASPSFLRYFGADDVAPGSDSFGAVHPDDRERIAEIFRYTVATGQGRRAEYRLVTRTGEVRYFESEGSPVRDRTGQVTHVVVVSRDVTERHVAEARIHHMAHHDTLTGLPNRCMLADCLSQALAYARRHRTRVAVMFVDLDHFKEINDSLGHDIGDGLLRRTAERIRGCLREEDMVARLGGDEFCVVMGTDNGQASIAHVAQKIIAALAEPAVITGQRLQVSGSIGISVYPDDGLDPKTLLKRADIAMYQVKKSGRNSFCFFRRDLQGPERPLHPDDAGPC